MSNLLTRFATTEPAACAVCHRHAFGIGYAPKNSKQPFIWLCDDGGCHGAAREVYKMPQRDLDAYELGAAIEGGNQGGAFLDDIGKTDLAKLDADEWREFLRRVITGFEVTMRKRILGGEPPF